MMRSLFKSLDLFERDNSMDYSEIFDEIKSILVYCNTNVKPFSKAFFRGGNEFLIKELSSRSRDLLLSQHLIDKETLDPLEPAYPILRKLTLFFLANTDTTYKYNLGDDPLIGHFVGVCPLMPRFLLIAIIWELKLDRFFYEALTYTPCWFSFQYFEPVSDSMKYITDPFDVLNKVDKLLKAIYFSVARSESRPMEVVEKKIIYNKLFDYTTNFLRLFYTPDAEKFWNFSKRQLYKYFGYALKHLFEVLLLFFDVYEQPQKAEPPPPLNEGVYELYLQQCHQACARTRPSAHVMEQLLKLINVILDALQHNVKQVKIDIFMYWVEVDLSETQNLQMVVGELAYKVCERMQNNVKFSHSVAEQLSLIAIRPKTLEEIVRNATLGEVLRRLDDDLPRHTKKLWFDEVINRTVALGNEECINSIRENLELMSVENCQQILDFIHMEQARNKEEKEHQIQFKVEKLSTDELQGEDEELEVVDGDAKTHEDLASLIIQSLVNFSFHELLQLVSYEVKKFGEDCTVCSTSGAEFHQSATKFLNKYSAAEFDLKGFLMLCFQRPQTMWTRFFESTCNNNDCHTLCVAVRDTRPFSDSYFHTLLTSVMHDPVRLQQKFFPALMTEIYFTLYHPERKTEFLKQVINKSVDEMLDSQNFAGLLQITKTLNYIAARGDTHSKKPLNFGEVTAPVLVMAAQILEKTRWDLITYTDKRDEVLRECIQFIQKTSKTFLPVATEKDRKWVTKCIKDSYRPITQYYFQKFSQAPDQPPIDFDNYLISLEIKEKLEVEMFLIMNYVRCTRKETEWLARSERLLPHISDMMIILGGVVAETANCNAVNNYRHCMVNYAHIVMKFILPKIENDKREIEKLILKVLKIIESSPAEIYEEIFMSFEWLLFEILKKYSQPVEADKMEHLQKGVDALRNCKAKEIFLEKLEVFAREYLG